MNIRWEQLYLYYSEKSYNYMFTKVIIEHVTKTKLFTYLGITIKQCANRSVNYRTSISITPMQILFTTVVNALCHSL